MQPANFHQLFSKYLQDDLSADEAIQLLQTLQQDTHREQWTQSIETLLQNKELHELSNSDDLPRIFNTIIHSKKQTIQMRVWKWAVAAMLILTIGSGIYYFNTQSYKPQKSSQITVQTKNAAQEISPGTNKAILTLSNGTQKELSVADNGLQLQSDAVLLTTPRGGQYQAVLPDGSRVWLNAASSLKFPSSFADEERRVEVTGEVYFEIAKDANKPFKVFGGNQEIEVLGTAFNVNIYADEPNAKISLTEGSIKVNNTILKPGEVWENGVRIQTNIEQDIAWKNGYFNMQNADIKTVMRAISRWYNVDIIYKGEISSKFRIQISRTTSLSDVLKILETTGKLKPEIQGNSVIIK